MMLDNQRKLTAFEAKISNEWYMYCADSILFNKFLREDGALNRMMLPVQKLHKQVIGIFKKPWSRSPMVQQIKENKHYWFLRYRLPFYYIEGDQGEIEMNLELTAGIQTANIQEYKVIPINNIFIDSEKGYMVIADELEEIYNTYILS